MIRCTRRAGVSTLRRIGAGCAGSGSSCVEEAGTVGQRRLCRQDRLLSSLMTQPSCFDSTGNGSNDNTVVSSVTTPLTSAATVSTHTHQQLIIRRFMGMYRRPHQKNLRDTTGTESYDDANPAASSEYMTADDMETYDFLSGDIFNSHPLEDDDVFRRTSSDGRDGAKGDREEDEEAKEERMRMDLEEERKAQAVRDELDRRTGRLWTNGEWEITDEDWFTGAKYDDLPDWNPQLCSRISLERVKVFEGGIPTLSDVSALPLPPSQPPHPASSNPKVYTKHVRRSIRSEIQAAVDMVAGDRASKIMELPTWEEKQDAVDGLFESIEMELREKGEDRMTVLASQPKFGEWVEEALERHLKNVAEASSRDEENDSSGEGTVSSTTDSSEAPTEEQDMAATPIFMDVLRSEDEGKGTPGILHPLQSHPKEGTGRMVEEWDLAANKLTKRIMIRQCVREIAQTLEDAGKEGYEGARRVYVKGTQGAGKSAALAAVVASARQSGQIVMYLPDGDRLRKLGYFIRPNSYREGDLFDLPVLAKEVCGQLLESHTKDLEGISVGKDKTSDFLSDDDWHKMHPEEEVDTVSLVDLLKAGSESNTLSSGCYAAVVDVLMNQTDMPFTVVIDGFNCYFDHGHYFHEAYDPDVIKAIPFQKITLFQPLLAAIGLEKSETRRGLCRTVEAAPMKRGAIVVGTTESHSVAGKFTEALSSAMEDQQSSSNSVKIVEVLPFTPVETEHILSNFEITGVGRLRFDRGDTVMNDQEVAYLRMVSGGIGQKLLDACIV